MVVVAGWFGGESRKWGFEDTSEYISSDNKVLKLKGR